MKLISPDTIRAVVTVESLDTLSASQFFKEHDLEQCDRAIMIERNTSIC